MRCTFLIVAGLLLTIPWQASAGNSYLESFNLPADRAYEGSESCLDCHDEVGEFYAHSPHSPSRALAIPGTDIAACESCHGPGSAHIENDGDGNIIGVEALQALTDQQRADMCLQCHASQAVNWNSGPHAGSGISCNDCHADQVHFGGMARPAADFRNQGEFCIQCHDDQVSDFRMPFRHRVLEGQISCGDCHDPHGGFDQLAWNGINETCTKCHAEMAGPFVFEHAGVTDEDCTACHKPHGSMHDKLLTQDGNTLCMQCHYDAGFSGFQIGGQAHSAMLGSEGRCTDCHGQVHGSNVDATLRN